MPAKIFVSHASGDRAAAAAVCKALENRGFPCWISSRDIGPGENFQVAIVQAIRSAKVMILIFSANAKNSEEIKKELVLAGQSHLVVIPVRVEDVAPDEAFAYEFATRQWIDLFENWEESVHRLAEQLDRIAEIGSASDTVPRVAEPDRVSRRFPHPQLRDGLTERKPRRFRGWLLLACALLLLTAGAALWAPGVRDRLLSQPSDNVKAAPPAATSGSAGPPSLLQALSERLKAAVPKLSGQAREDALREYSNAKAHKAQAVSIEPPAYWTTSTWLSRQDAADGALEGCQLRNGHPCALVVVDDELQPAAADGKLSVRDMPRTGFAGNFDPAQIPYLPYATRERSDVVHYSSFTGPKAVAYHPQGGRLFIITQGDSQQTVEESALKACNDDTMIKRFTRPCFLYAVGNRVVLPLRLTGPLTAPTK